MADESVVVFKSQPMKAGNRVEGKTEPTYYLLIGRLMTQKGLNVRREEVILKEGSDLGHD